MNKTSATSQSVSSFLVDLPESQKRDSEALVDLMQNISGEPPQMWGSSIIGFGTHHYKYESGREGDIPIVSFSPRKTYLTIYVNQGFDELGDLLDKLGPHTTSVSCLYIRRLEDVDTTVLRDIVEHTYRAIARPEPEDIDTPQTVDEYINLFDEPQRQHLDTIRDTIRALAPRATEKISYKIAAFELNGRTLLYYGGFKDHVSMYPIPKGMEKELAKYTRGKGTLWFPLDKPIPTSVIRKVTIAHIALQKSTAKSM